MSKNRNSTNILKYDKKYPNYIKMPYDYWRYYPFAYKQINGETYVTRVYISAGNRKEHVS